MYLNKKSNELCQYNKNLFKKIDAQKLTKKYLKGKILSENEVIKLRKKNFVGIVLRLPIIFGFNDHTKRLDFYFSRFKKRKEFTIE